MRGERTSESRDAIDFRSIVQYCAREPQLVDWFNRASGAHLKAPIESLLDDRWLFAAEEEQLAIGCFIVFVHENIWRRLKTAQRRAGSLLGRESA